MINNELLEALLSPDAYRRQAAESHFASLGVHGRIEGLIRHLVEMINSRSIVSVCATTTSESAAAAAASTTQLAAVLLRRDILQLTQASELTPLVGRLLSLLLTNSSNKNDGSSWPRRGINDCLAQVCSSLQILDMPVAVDIVTTILKV
jgi:hypothetical protein